jgi:hypothetical protein
LTKDFISFQPFRCPGELGKEIACLRHRSGRRG